MPIIRRKLEEKEVYPADLRYNEATNKVESLINDEWVENEKADPRHQISYPPRITSDPKCDAAQSVTDAFKNQIDQVITAISNGLTAFQIASLILGVFSFGLFALFIALALTLGRAMLAAGSAALNAALTPTAYDTFTCILYCAMNDEGQMTQDGLAQAETDVNAQIGGLGALVLNSMLALAGEGGVTNLAALGGATGDCSDCECECADAWCYVFDFTIDAQGWSADPAAAYGTYVAGVGWKGSHVSSVTSLNISIPYPTGDTQTTKIEVFITAGFDQSSFVSVVYVESVQIAVTMHQSLDNDERWETNALDAITNKIRVNPSSTEANEAYTIYKIVLHGCGENPFGSDNC